MGNPDSFGNSIERRKELRKATVSIERGGYRYTFDPPLSLVELEANPQYKELVAQSLFVGGFAKASTIGIDGSAGGFLELQITKSPSFEYASSFFALLRKAGIADIKITTEYFRPLHPEITPEPGTEEAVWALLKRQGEVGGNVHPTVEGHFDTGIKRMGFIHTKEGKELGFVPVDHTDAQMATAIVSLDSAFGSYLGRYQSRKT